MKALRFAAVALVLGACGSLKEALPESPGPSADAGPSAKPDGGTGAGDDDDVGPLDDAGTIEGGRCNGPCPPELVADSASASTLALDHDNVYFATNTPGASSVNVCPKTGCAGAAPTKLALGRAAGLAIIDGNVYWGDQDTGQIRRCAAGGCALAPTSIATGEADARGVWTDGLRLVWATSKEGGAIRYCDAAACSPATAIANLGTVIEGIATDQGKVFWSNGVKTYGCALDGCTPYAVAPASKQNTIYGPRLFSISGGAITECATTGCNQSPSVIGISRAPAALAVDGNALFWRDAIDDAIYRCSSAGCAGTPTVLAVGQATEIENAGMAVDGLYVYWASSTQVLRTRKTN